MQDSDLFEYSDAEKRYVQIHHRLFVHPIRELSVSGVMFLSCGLSLILFAYQYLLLSASFTSIAVLLQIYLFSDIVKPCSCNRIPVLTLQERKKVVGQKQYGYLVIYALLFCCFGVFLAPSALATFTGAVFLLYGVISCGMAISNKFDRYLRNRVVYGYDHARLSDLNMNEPNDIHELIRVSISAGNMDLADKYSSSLVKMFLETEKKCDAD